MFAKHPPLTIRPDGSLFQLQWIYKMWRNCTASRYATNKERMLRLSSYSRVCLDALRDEIGIQYEGRSQGTLQVFRTQQHMDAAGQAMKVLQDAGIRQELLGRDEMEETETGRENT